jgi:hypothetical protein
MDLPTTHAYLQTQYFSTNIHQAGNGLLTSYRYVGMEDIGESVDNTVLG